MTNKEYVCWGCKKCRSGNEMENACNCSTINSQEDKWVDFKITKEMVGLKTCPLVICKECWESCENDSDLENEIEEVKQKLMSKKTSGSLQNQGGQ